MEVVVPDYEKTNLYNLKVNLKGTRCTITQFLALLAIYKECAVTAHFLKKIDIFSTSRARSTLESLVKRQLVQYEETAKKIKRYSLTQKGREFIFHTCKAVRITN